MATKIRAIETLFDGYRFRSRLEARWAVFFTELGIDYGYETEGFDFDGTRYLPDFYLPALASWVEIKPGAPHEDEDNKVRLLSAATKQLVYIFFGDVGSALQSDSRPGFSTMSPPQDSAYAYKPYEDDGETTVVWDNYHAWCQCPTCLHLSIQFQARAERGCSCVDGDKGYRPFSPQLASAYDIARSYRFGGVGSIA